MSIPKMTEDLAIIQKLSDLPNSTEGLTADQLKAKFDQAVLAFQSWLNETLIPAIVAAQIPFTASSEINADTVDGAIRAVHSQVKDAASGNIVNGSVTAEKLSETLLERIYGGRPWVGLDTPGSGQNVAAGYPIGQIWLRPAFTVTNAAGTGWTGSGCTVSQKEDRFTVTGNNTVTLATATQVLGGLGQDGDRVYVLFFVENRDSELTALTVSLNGGGEQDVSAGVFTGELSGGTLTVKLSATWPRTSLAGGSYDIVNFTVVNVDAILRQNRNARDMSDWAEFLSGLLPLTTYNVPAQVWIQTDDGNWWPMGMEVLPVSRGGTGLKEPGADGSFLQMVDGLPQWQSAQQAAESGSLLRVVMGSYTGTGSSQTVSLPVEPKLINISSPSGTAIDRNDGSMLTDRPVSLGQGGRDAVRYYVSSGESWSLNTSTVELNGDTLTMTGGKLCSREGVTYNWVAVY